MPRADWDSSDPASRLPRWIRTTTLSALQWRLPADRDHGPATVAAERDAESGRRHPGAEPRRPNGGWRATAPETRARQSGGRPLRRGAVYARACGPYDGPPPAAPCGAWQMSSAQRRNETPAAGVRAFVRRASPL